MRLPLLALSLVSTTLVACSDDPPTPGEVRTALRDDLAPTLREGTAATDATANLPTGAAFGFATSVGGDTALRVVAPIAQRIVERVTPTQTRPNTHYLDGEEGTGADTDALVERLETELFTDANYLGNGVYRVPAEMVCMTTTYDETTGVETESLDPECADKLAQAQIRVRVEHDGSGLRFFLQVDANHDEPLSFYVAHNELAVTVNLDDATDAMVALAAIAGEAAPNADLAGSITGSMHVLGTAHAKLALSFDRAIAIKFASDGVGLDSDAAWRFTSAAGDIVAVELDANAPSGDFDLGLGETTVHVPGDDIDPASRDIVLGGATVNASFNGETVTMQNISLGSKTTTVSVGGAQGLSIDLNPADGRKLDATISVDATTGDETVTVTPKYDLHQTVDHAIMGDEAPVYDVTRVTFDGSVRGSSLGDSFEVLSGSVTVETSPSQYGYTATAGQCVQETEVYDDVTYTSYTTFSVGACP